MTDAERILNRLNARLDYALKTLTPVDIEAHTRGYYGIPGDFAGWPLRAGKIAEALWSVRFYSVLDLGCNVGAKAPLLTAWGCVKYLGLDMHESYIDAARKRWASGVCEFRVANFLMDAIPTGYDVFAMTYVFQHLRLSQKRDIVSVFALHAPRLIILVDDAIRSGTLEDCAREYEPQTDTLVVPYPLSELQERLPEYTIERPDEALYLLRRKT